MKPMGLRPAKIMLVDECYRDADLKTGTPFSGYSGTELSKVLMEVGIILNTCYSTWAVKQHLPNGGEGCFPTAKKNVTDNHVLYNDKWAHKCVVDGLEELVREIESVQPNIIIAFGNTAMWCLTGKWGIGSWRGSQLECNLPGLSYQPQVIPVYPIGRVFANWSWRPILKHDLKRAQRESRTRELILPDYHFLIRPNYGQVLATLDKLYSKCLSGPTWISCDIETRSRHTACIGLAWGTLDAICIPLMCVEREAGYWSLEEETQITYRLYKLLSHKNCLVIGQFFHYDIQYFERYQLFRPNLTFDTLIAQHSCFSNMPKSLDYLSSMYCEFHRYWKDDGKEWNASILEDELWEYNCKDAVITYEVCFALKKTIEQLGLQEVSAFQQELFWPVLEAMTFGCFIDKKLKNSFINELLDEIAIREQWLYDVLGVQLNIKSPVQMQDLFYNVLNQEPILQRKTRNVTCDDEALAKIAEREPLLQTLCNKIQELRSLGVFLKNFAMAPLDIDGRMRCTFNVGGGAETYRLSSTKNPFGTGMNLQNIPKGGEEETLTLPNIRVMFIPDPGYEDFDIDLDSADLRIVCWESNCIEMKAMINEGKKVYVEVAKEYYKDPTITKYHPSYKFFKSFCHGTNYLGTAKGLAGRLGLLVKESEDLQKWYFGKFPEIPAWHEKIKHQVMTRRYVENVFGYRVYILDRIEGTIFNQVIAWIPQSTVGCLINRAWMNIHKNLPEVRVKIQVHDSLQGQYLISQREYCQRRILEEAAIELPYADKTIIPVGIKCSTKSWGDCG